MPHPTLTGTGTQRAMFSIVEIALPGQAPQPAGVLLFDPDQDRLLLRFRRDWEQIASPDDAQVCALLAEDMERRAAQMGAAVFLQSLEDTLSNTIRITDREAVLTANLESTLDRLYRRHVPSTVQPYLTHLPRYAARVAAGKFLDDHEVEPDEWIETPESFRPEPGMFVSQITGHSMEPRIPDGSLCVFRAGVGGTRQGKLLLIENRGVSDSGGRYTVKRYRSIKKREGETWRHAVIRLEPLNPAFEAWELDDDAEKFRVIGEFVAVLAAE